MNGASMASAQANRLPAISPTCGRRATPSRSRRLFKAPRDDKTLSSRDVQRAFLDANPRLRPGMMAITCRRGVLQEARICFSKDLRDFVACPQVARQSCSSPDLFVPAGR